MNHRCFTTLTTTNVRKKFYLFRLILSLLLPLKFTFWSSEFYQQKLTYWSNIYWDKWITNMISWKLNSRLPWSTDEENHLDEKHCLNFIFSLELLFHQEKHSFNWVTFLIESLKAWQNHCSGHWIIFQTEKRNQNVHNFGKPSSVFSWSSYRKRSCSMHLN